MTTAMIASATQALAFFGTAFSSSDFHGGAYVRLSRGGSARATPRVFDAWTPIQEFTSTSLLMQVCHGKGGPLRRIRPGDRVAYYSPSTVMRGTDKLQAFTAYGRVKDGDPYVFDMGGGFRPFRRDVAWERAQTVPIRPLLGALAFTSDDRNWGYKLRFGLFEIGGGDMDLIERAMGAEGEITPTATA
jgi:hypothetical protein